AQRFSQSYTYTAAAGWMPELFGLEPGEGAALYLPVATTFTFAGEQIAPRPVALAPGLNLFGAQQPKPAGYADIVGMPAQEGATVYQLETNGNPFAIDADNYRVSYFRNGEWHDHP